jgi:hypothetical protein
MMVTILFGLLSVALISLGIGHCRGNGYHFSMSCTSDKCSYSSFFNKVDKSFVLSRDGLKDVELVRLDKHGNAFPESESSKIHPDHADENGYTVQFKVDWALCEYYSILFL